MILIYIPPVSCIPSSNYIVEINTAISKIINILNEYPKAKFIITGDFNFPSYTWDISENLLRAKGRHPNNLIRTAIGNFGELFNYMVLHQAIDSSKNPGNNLDLCFTNFEILDCSTSLDPLCSLDKHHNPLVL